MATGASQEEASEDEGFLCGICDAVFATMGRGANTHRGRVHRIGTMVPIKEFVASRRCPVCGKDIRTRLRAVHHFSAETTLAMSAGEDAATLAAADAVDRATRRVAKALGLSPLASLGQYAG